MATVESLLDQDPHLINENDLDGYPALIRAVMADKTDDQLVAYNQIAMVELLLERQADLEGKNTHGKHTALTLAAFFGRKEFVQLLVDAGADLEVRNKMGYSAQELAEKNNHPEVAQIITEAIEARRIEALHRIAQMEEQARLTAAEITRREMVADKQERMKKRAPKLKIPAGPSP